jgi:hypothetical protein
VRLSQKYQTCPFIPGPHGQPNIHYDKRKTANSKPTNSK